MNLLYNLSLMGKKIQFAITSLDNLCAFSQICCLKCYNIFHKNCDQELGGKINCFQFIEDKTKSFYDFEMIKNEIIQTCQSLSETLVAIAKDAYKNISQQIKISKYLLKTPNNFR